jgi:hypothetical protein
MGNGPTCAVENPVCVDPGTTARTASQTPGPVCDVNWFVSKVTHEMETEAFNFGSRFIKDAAVRANYFREIRKMSEDILKRVKSGQTSALDGATEANTLRNEIMEAGRMNSSDIGLAEAQRLKKTGRTLEELQEKGAMKKFGRSFEELEEAEQNQVLLGIVESAGRPLKEISLKAAKLGRLGKSLIVLTIALAVYNIATADDKVEATAREVGDASAGVLGGMGGGALAGLACGPGAPVCVTVGVFVGGALAALGMDLTFDWIKKKKQ